MKQLSGEREREEEGSRGRMDFGWMHGRMDAWKDGCGCMERWMDAWKEDRYIMQDIDFEPRPAY